MLKQRTLRFSLGLLVTFILIAHTGGILPLRFIKTLENFSYDFHMQLSLPSELDRKVVIIDIDEKSLSSIGQWPWERNKLADIVDSLFEHYKISVLGFDVLFAEKDENSADRILQALSQSAVSQSEDFQKITRDRQDIINRDQVFARSLSSRNIVMGMVFTNDEQHPSALPKDKPRDKLRDNMKGSLPPSIPQITQNLIDNLALINATGYTANIEPLQEQARFGGFFDNPLIDEDGVFRRVPLLQTFNGKAYPSLALAITLATTHASLSNRTLELGYNASDENSKLLQWLYLGETAIPVDERAAVMVPYAGPQRTFQYISAVDILNQSTPRHLLEGKIAVVGTSAAGLADLITTPLESGFPGVEVHANIIQGILDQQIRHKPEYMTGFEILILLLLGFFLSILLPLLSPAWSTLAAVLSTGFILLLDNYAWHQLMVIMSVAPLLILVAALFTINMSYGYFIESRNKRHLTRLFGQYVPPELVDEMSRSQKEINLDGEIRNMTVLFTDVRGFTTLSEKMEPKELTAFINAFLTPLTHVIHHNQGTIDKYMGDAIMAFWGAPLKDPHHARNALNAGMEMLQAIKQLNKELLTQGKAEIKIGIGINTGDMNVGNKGSEFRVDYTVLGDSVNLGSRLEGLTKNYGVDFIVNETTCREVPEYEYRKLDYVKVKGKDKPVTIYEPVGLATEIEASTQQQINNFHLALSHFYAQQWDDAEKILRQLNRQEPERMVYTLYIERIAFFRNKSPGESWDGVYTHTTK
ncbi:Adenylate cyclase [hydrothermal vent metagenome]|uniref:Adenylate cyclase n=1 Tax=hydrothermal vent metagenome TaxID=652676 RepID=A0A3B0XYW7_9ZZZZ